MSPSTTSTTEVPRMALLFTLPVNEQASRITTPIKININPKFFNNSLTGEIIWIKNPL